MENDNVPKNQENLCGWASATKYHYLIFVNNKFLKIKHMNIHIIIHLNRTVNISVVLLRYFIYYIQETNLIFKLFTGAWLTKTNKVNTITLSWIFVL